MDFNENYYAILGVSNTSTISEIKKAYYKLSFKLHPDRNKDTDIELFHLIVTAYDILSSEKREEYDIRSKWGSNYDESTEFLDFEYNNNAKIWDKSKYEEWKKVNQLNVIIRVDDTFNGTVEYDRWVTCKVCGGDGRDTKSKIEIKDENGKVLRLFDGSDGCDFCDGSGKNWKGEDCYFCGGKGKVGLTECKTCNGERRILGKQKLSKIKIPKGKKEHKIESMGHVSKDGRSGCVWIIKD